MKIVNVVGARPNFMKMAPILEAMRARPAYFQPLLVHTGQHYDARMSQAFFDDLGMPRPDIDLGIGSGSHAVQTARVMQAFEPVLLEYRPDRVMVVGDVNSTLACALVAVKLGIPVAHVEAGLRSRDMGMPEEINRLCTDAICDLLFTTDRLADANLRAEGVAEQRIHFVGNVMIDTLFKHRELARGLGLCSGLGLQPGRYAVLTLHRPSNVDDPRVFAGIVDALERIGAELPVVFPIHPRTRKMAAEFGLLSRFNDGRQPRGVWLLEPLGYLEFLHLVMHARLVLTDSGGLQEETTVLGVPCLTLRRNTERPITVSEGTNRIVGNDPQAIIAAFEDLMVGAGQGGRVPERWDGRAAERIVEVLVQCGCARPQFAEP